MYVADANPILVIINYHYNSDHWLRLWYLI